MVRRAGALGPRSIQVVGRSLCTWLGGAVVVAGLGGPAGAADPPPDTGLPVYEAESTFLVDTPGSSSSVAAGLFNPAAWGIQRGGGLFLAWDDVSGDLAGDDYMGVLSARHLAFGVRQFQFEPTSGDPFRVRDYTLGTSVGTRSASLGLAYAWGGGDLDRHARHERLVLGSVTRSRFASLGLAWTHDLEVSGDVLQADLGIRPLGPRLTLFGDAVLHDGDSFGDIESGYGVEAKLLPGLALAAKARSTGEVSLRLGVALSPQSELGFRPHLDDGGDRVASTYTLEFGPAHGFLTQELQRDKARRFPAIALKGRLAYQRFWLFDERPTLLGTLAEIERVANDPTAAGVVVNLSGATMQGELAWEIREQLAALRAAGKKVVVYIDRGGLYPTMLASVADQVWMDPTGQLDLRGLAMGRTFMRAAFGKLGLGVEEWRFLTYKSAFEAYSRESMSEADREQRQALVDDFYATASAAIMTSRGLTTAAWESVVNDKGVLLPEEAQAAGLVDSLGGFQRAVEAAKRVAPSSRPTASQATLAGVHGDPTWGPEEWGEPARIAVFYAIGSCDMDTGIRGRTLAEEIRKAGKNRAVRAIVLRADSPGGDPLPSDLVARALRETAKRKPVIVSQGQLAASGGYWISMDADTIVASPLTLTGSIGVIAGWVWNEEFGAKVGLAYDGVKHGKSADMEQGIRLPVVDQVIPARNLTSEERTRMENLMRTMYADFVAKVATGRGLDAKYVDSIGQGRVWSGTRGQEKQLVDELGGLWRSLQIAKAAAGLPAERAVQLVERPGRGAVDLSGLQPRLIRDAWGTLIGRRVHAPRGAEDAGSEAALVADPSTPLGATAAAFSPAEREFLGQVLRHNGQPLLLVEPFEIRDGSPQP